LLSNLPSKNTAHFFGSSSQKRQLMQNCTKLFRSASALYRLMQHPMTRHCEEFRALYALHLSTTFVLSGPARPEQQPAYTSYVHVQHVCSVIAITVRVCSLQKCNDADFTACHQVIAELNSLVKSGLCNQNGMRIEPYGSLQSKLHFPMGDLDLSIEGTYTQL